MSVGPYATHRARTVNFRPKAYVLKDNSLQRKIKDCVYCFLSNFYSSPNDSPSKTIKNVFYFIKKAFLFSRYSNFCIFVFPSFFHCQPLLEKLIQEQSNPRKKVYDVINCLSKNLITHFV